MSYGLEYWLGTAVLTASAPLSFVFGFQELRTSREVRDLPTSKVRSAAQGYTELEGIGIPIAKPELCPLTDTTCLWWHYTVEEYRRDVGDKNAKWHKVEDEKSTEHFWLDDGTGRCRVDPAKARIIPSYTRQWYGRSPEDARRPLQKIRFFRKYRYTERFLYPKGPLYALGEFRTVTADRQAVVDEAVRARLDAWRKDPAMMKLLDLNKDGRVDQKEWAAAMRMARMQVERAGVSLAEPIHTLSHGDRAYIIAGKPQKEVRRILRRAARGWLAWFVFAVPASAFCILHPLGYL